MKISVIEFIYNVFSCDQASLWIVQSVCWLVGLSHILSLCFHHRSIMKISGVNTIDRSDVHANGQGQRSKVKVTEVKTQFSRFRTITPVWIHMWWWNDAQSLMWYRKGALYFFSRSSIKFQDYTGQKITNFDLNRAFLDCNISLNSLMAMKWCTKLNIA